MQWWYNNKGEGLLAEEMPEGYNCGRLGTQIIFPEKTEEKKESKKEKKSKKAD
jgi:hypothetical protein